MIRPIFFIFKKNFKKLKKINNIQLVHPKMISLHQIISNMMPEGSGTKINKFCNFGVVELYSTYNYILLTDFFAPGLYLRFVRFYKIGGKIQSLVKRVAKDRFSG